VEAAGAVLQLSNIRPAFKTGLAGALQAQDKLQASVLLAEDLQPPPDAATSRAHGKEQSGLD
jgi:hypothetical protein